MATQGSFYVKQIEYFFQTFAASIALSRYWYI